MDHFIKPVDELSRLIEEKAKILYSKIFDLPVKEFNLPDFPLKYYIACHDKRKFFSVQTAAEILYRSIMHKGKALDKLVIMDYGAGLGSLFLLAKMIGVRTVVYNDILEDMTNSAKIISNYLGIPIDLFISGDHRHTVNELKKNNLECDIVLSRNVVEHIYDLNDFYRSMAEGQPNALIYFSTTANFQNPAMMSYHKKLHAGYEKEYCPKRKSIIQQKLPGIDEATATRLAEATRGLALQDLDQAIEDHKLHHTFPDPSIHHTNTCDPETGLWQEHIIPVSEYKTIVESKGYRLTVLPAFWDTHYESAGKNLFARAMNWLTGVLGPKKGLTVTAFIYIIAEKK